MIKTVIWYDAKECANTTLPGGVYIPADQLKPGDKVRIEISDNGTHAEIVRKETQPCPHS